MPYAMQRLALIGATLANMHAGLNAITMPVRIAQDGRARKSKLGQLTEPTKADGASQSLKELGMFFLALRQGVGVTVHRNLQSPQVSRLGVQTMKDGSDTNKPFELARRAVFAALVSADAAVLAGPGYTSRPDVSNFKRFTQFQLQYIAALGDPEASSGTGADKWGLWEKDPGPRGVRLKNFYDDIVGGQAPAGWTFDSSRWWLEEHGLIMETPAPLLLQKRYLVSGGRETTSVLSVYNDGRWELDKGTLYDVTHLPCRAAVYTDVEKGTCVPTEEAQRLFPVKPGAKMPKIDGCKTQDWQVLFVVGVEE